MDLYWVSVLIQDGTEKAWKASCYDACVSLPEAERIIRRYRTNYNVLASWVDKETKDNGRELVKFDCYVDVTGDVKKVA